MKNFYNSLDIMKSENTEFLSKSDCIEACGADNRVSIVLKSLPTLSNPLLIVYKAAISKGCFPSY